MPVTERELRSLVTLLDDEDQSSVELVRRQILTVGDRALPYLDELRHHGAGELAARAEEVADELRYLGIRREFESLAQASDPDLEKGVFLLAKFGHPQTDLRPYTSWLDRVAGRVQDELPNETDQSVLFQRLNSHLFQALGFNGNESRYYDPDNSFVHRVIETRRGIPVSLSVIYLLLAKRLGLSVYGVATPGHFLIGFRPGPQPCFLDAYHKGRIMDLHEVRRMLLRGGYEFRPDFVDRCSNRDIMARMMRNLTAIYEKAGAAGKAERLAELTRVLLGAPND